MTPTKKSGTVERMIESGREAEEAALEALRKFLDTVDSVLPDIGQEGPRRKIIDSAIKMTEQLVDTWTQLAEKIPEVVRERRRTRPSSEARPRNTTAKSTAKRTTGKATKRRAPARRATTTKATAKRTPAKKTAAKKSTAKKAPARRTPARKAASR